MSSAYVQLVDLNNDQEVLSHGGEVVERRENQTQLVDFFFLQSPKFLQTPKRSALHHLGLIQQLL
jgi:hypothetical protein